MIVGIGMDITEIDRIRELLDRPAGERFLKRVLTPAERAAAGKRQHRLAEYAAGRFAAKESAAKALGTGIGAVVGFQDIEILQDDKGRPACRISDEALARAGLDCEVKVHLTITHTDRTAAACVVIERL
jgi:holo-[acyl-carrier protein] synthase